MIPEAQESDRYAYNLNRQSLCIDAGAYEGNWSKEVHLKYGARVDAYEPVTRFFERAATNLRGLDKVRLYNFGVAAEHKTVDVHVQNDSSGAFAASAEVEKCKMLSLTEVLKIAGVKTVEVLKLNVEGMEFEILESMLTAGDPVVGAQVNRFRNLQVQFHMCVPDFQRRYDAIAGDLSQTHELTWRTPFVWENWRLKP